MAKIVKTISILSLVVSGLFLLVQGALAIGGGGLIVEVCSDSALNNCQTLDETNHSPLFNEANFLPGDDVSRWVRVSNSSLADQELGVEVTGSSFACLPGDLADVIELTIKENSTELYKDSLSSFYSAGELYLSPIANEGVNVYQFSAVFEPGTGDSYQGCSTQFDFQIGFWGESISDEVDNNGNGNGGGSGGGGGGGAIIIAGLEITKEQASPVQSTSATITWQTNKDATSRVVYASENESYSFDWTNSPNYGYPHSTIEDSTKKTGHSVTITGLNSGTTYYFRCISHASPDTVSSQHSFTTLAEKSGPANNSSNNQAGETAGGSEGSQAGGTANSQGGSETGAGPEVAGGATSTLSGHTYNSESNEAVKEESSLLASIASFFGGGEWCLVLLGILILLCLVILFSFKKKERETHKERRVVLILITFVLTLLYCFFCKTSVCLMEFCSKYLLCALFVIILAVFTAVTLLGRKSE